MNQAMGELAELEDKITGDQDRESIRGSMLKLKERKPASWRVLKLFKEMTMQSSFKKR